MKSRSLTIGLLSFGLMGLPLLAAADQPDQAGPARPGTVNYVEGAAYLEGSRLNSKDIGYANLDAGQVLTTRKGKAEILLTPGVFLRLDNNSAVKMISPDLTLTQLQLEKGRAGIEVDEIHDQNDLQILDNGVTTRLNKKGFYEFEADHPEALVFTGEAHAEVADGRWEEIKGHHELALGASANGAAKVKTADFSEQDAKDDFYNWNSLRSQYLAEANNQMAGEYGGAGYYPGWFWDPYAFGFTYMGIGPFASPFGWGFYPFGWGGPWGGWYGPVGGWYGGYHGVRVGGGFGGFHGRFGGFGGGGGRR